MHLQFMGHLPTKTGVFVSPTRMQHSPFIGTWKLFSGKFFARVGLGVLYSLNQRFNEIIMHAYLHRFGVAVFLT